MPYELTKTGLGMSLALALISPAMAQDAASVGSGS